MKVKEKSRIKGFLRTAVGQINNVVKKIDDPEDETFYLDLYNQLESAQGLLNLVGKKILQQNCERIILDKKETSDEKIQEVNEIFNRMLKISPSK